jgi:hypothetical protein
VIVGPRGAAADSLTVTWNPVGDAKVVGYRVYVGPKPGSDTGSHEVSGATVFVFPDAVPGEQYCFAVAALAGSVEGKKSSYICGYSNAVPVLAAPGSPSTVVGRPTTLQLKGSDPLGEPVSYSASSLPPGLDLHESTGLISGTPTTAGTYEVEASVSDGMLFASRIFTWTIKPSADEDEKPPATDTTAPTISIITPTSGPSYATTTSTLTLSGTAADAVGVKQVSWTSDRGGSGTAIGTTTWTVPNVPMRIGSNVITVTARDAAGNVEKDRLTVTLSEPAVLKLADLKPSLSAPQPAGATIMWTAEVTGGTAPFHYKWWLHDGTNWTVLQDWTPVSWYVWTPTKPNPAYRVGVWVRKSTSTADTYDNPLSNGSVSFAVSAATGSTPITLVSLTADQVAPRPVGTTVTWTANATGGSGGLQYKWWLHDGSKWNVLQEWTSSATYRWQPTKANLAYRVGVWIRKATSTADAYDNPSSNGSVAFPITTSPTSQQLVMTSLTADKPAPQGVGTTITWTATATGGSAPYQYKWWVYDGARWSVLKDWSTSNTYAWRPTTANPAYRVGVWIRNSTSSADEYDNPLSNGSVGFAVK